MGVAEHAPIIGECRADLYAEHFVERQHAVVEQIGGSHRNGRRLHPGERPRAELGDDDLCADLADAPDDASADRVPIQ